MTRYRKKPVIIDAVQWTGDNDADINNFVPGHVLCWSSEYKPCIETLEGTMVAEIGDWIIRGIKHEFYPCKNDVFEATYERVETGQ